MKLKLILPGALLILIAGAFFYPVTKQTGVIINASMFTVYNQLSKSENWVKWDHELRTGNVLTEQLKDKKGFTISTPSVTTRVEFPDAFTFRVTKEKERYDIVLIPEKYDKTTTVLASFKSNLLYQLLPGMDKWQKKTPVADLKDYMESPLTYYGVDLKKTTVKDMDMMVYSTEVNPANQFTEMARWAKKIRDLIPAAELADSTKIYLQLTPVNNQLTMLIGVPVKKQLPEIGGITYRPVPGGKILTVNYEGKYAERKKVYTSVGTYLQDHSMKNAIQPVETFTNNGLPVNDTSRVKMQIIFHVF